MNAPEPQAFPYNLKNAQLSPVFKRHDNLDTFNYRPVSVLTAVSKFNESVMNDQLSISSIYSMSFCVPFERNIAASQHLLKWLKTRKNLSIRKILLVLFSWTYPRRVIAYHTVF